MDNPSKPPILISKFDQVLEQLHLLFRDIEEFKMDSGVVVMLKDGVADIRGLGEAHSPAAAAAILFLAFRSMPTCHPDELSAALGQLLQRSHQIATEAPLWRGAPNLHQPPL